MMPTLASMQCACACIAALRDATANAAIWPKHCSAAIAVRYDCFYQRRVPTTVVEWVAEPANGTNGCSTAAGSSAASACLLLVPHRPLASPARLGPRATTRATRNTEASGDALLWALQRRHASSGACPEQNTQACAAIKPPKPPSEEELRVRLSRRSGAKHVQRAAARVAAAL